MAACQLFPTLEKIKMGIIEMESLRGVQIRDISREVLSKFKKVRQLESSLYGPYALYSKAGAKYIAKFIPHPYQLATSRHFSPIFRHISPQGALYLFPLRGESLSQWLQRGAEGFRRWVQRCGGVEGCLWEVARKLLRAVESGAEVLLECLRVSEGELEYCWDSWMRNSMDIVRENSTELENYYFSPADLEHLKTDAPASQPTQQSLHFRICLLLLHLGSSPLKQRTYEYGLFRLNSQHLAVRLEYFCSRYGGLGELVRKVIEGKSYEMDEIWRINAPDGLKSRKILAVRSSNLKPHKHLTETHEKQDSPQKAQFSSTLSSFTPANKQGKGENRVEKQGKEVSRSHSSLSLNSDHPDRTSKSKPKSKQYQLYKSAAKEPFPLRSRLLQNALIPPSCPLLLSFLGLEEYLPNCAYQESVLQALQGARVKPDWRRELFDNGAIYLGEGAEGRKEGRGLYLFGSSDFYYGDWKDNAMHGYGTYVFLSGEVYEGQLANGSKQGHGRCLYPDGRLYQGSWSNNYKAGLGKVQFPNGVVFVGLFRAGQQTQGLFVGPPDQQGRPLWENAGVLQQYRWQQNALVGSREEGQEKKQKLGQCKSQFYAECIDLQGYRYEGEMKDAKRQGFGILTSEKEVYEGAWKQDKRDGFGRMEVKGGLQVEGEWKDDVLVKYHIQDELEVLF